MKDKLRELAERWIADANAFSTINPFDVVVAKFLREHATELLAILDAEGDGGAVAEVIAGYSIKWLGPDYACSLAPGTKLYAHPARSGVVSDEDVEAACVAMGRVKGFYPSWPEMRAALEHFAKGERHER